MGEIIRNPTVLTTDFEAFKFPSIMYERPEYLNLIMKKIFIPTIKNNPEKFSFMIYGTPGSGKTTLIRYAAKKAVDLALEKMITNFDIMYYRCRENTSLKEILTFLLSKKDRWSGESTYIQETVDLLKNRKLFIVLIVDEIEKIKDPYVLYTLVHTFARPNENEFVKMSLKDGDIKVEYALIPVLITNNFFKIKETMKKTGQADVDQDLMMFDKIVIPYYRAPELYEIIKRRAMVGLYRSSYDVDENGEVLVFRLMAKELVSNFGVLGPQGKGLGREAVKLLRFSAEIAEERRSKKIERRDVFEGIERIYLDDLYKFISTLGEHAVFTLEALYQFVKLKAMRRKTIQDFSEDVIIKFSYFYEMYKEVAEKYGYKPVSDRQFKRYLEKLADYRIIGFESRTGYWLIESEKRIGEVLTRLASEIPMKL